MFERLLNRFGYVRAEYAICDCELYNEMDKNLLSEDELSLMLAKKLGVLDAIDEEYEKKIFADLKGTDGLVAYLREAAARDKDRYFGATTKEEQLVIRGSFARTMYLKAKIMSSGEPAKKQTKVEGVNYG